MSDHEIFALESNGLLDFLPTPPESTSDVEANTDRNEKTGKNGPHPSTIDVGARPASPVMGYGSPPPDYDEEPSDFEDEVRGILDREKRATSLGLDSDDDENDLDDHVPSQAAPVASCESFSPTS